MPDHLPNGDRAILDVRKLDEYCLSDTHPRGRHKARVFRAALGLRAEDAAWLREVLLDAARTADAQCIAHDDWGDQWRLDVTVARGGRTAVVRTMWLVRRGETLPRFVTGWVKE